MSVIEATSIATDQEMLRAEEEGFEPPEACTSAVFKTAAFNHSATPPWACTTPLRGRLVVGRTDNGAAVYPHSIDPASLFRPLPAACSEATM